MKKIKLEEYQAKLPTCMAIRIDKSNYKALGEQYPVLVHESDCGRYLVHWFGSFRILSASAFRNDWEKL